MSTVFSWRLEEFDDLVASCDRDTATPYILRYIPFEGKVVEAGCGLARYVKFLSDRGYDIVGIELSQDTVDMVTERAPELDVRQGDVIALPFGNDSISGVISHGVVEHFIEGPQKPLKEIYRVLKAGYHAVITVPSYNLVHQVKHASGVYHISPSRNLKRLTLVRRLFGKGPFVPREVPYRKKGKAVPGVFFQYLFTKQEFEEALCAAGFTVVESIPVALIDGLYHDFGKGLVTFRNWTFYPTWFGKHLNSLLGKIPFCHNHMHLCVVRK